MTELAALHSTHGVNLEILCYPSNEFGQQELSTPQTAALFSSYGLPIEGGGATLMSMVELNGPSTDAVWNLAKRAFPGGIYWNFAGTFLFDQHGQPVGRFRLPSELDRLREQIAALLPPLETHA